LIYLDPPEYQEVMIDDSFAMPEEQAMSLAELLFQASCGNPFLSLAVSPFFNKTLVS
jgi:hypothetical protein